MATEEPDCASLVRRWRSAHASQPDAETIVTFATKGSLPKRWLLGLSAALHGVPLVVSGLRSNWTGFTSKLFAAQQAIQLLHDASPGADDSRIVYADAADTLIVRPPGHARRVVEEGAGEAVLVSGECSMYPLCYRAEYERWGAAHLQQCAERRRNRLFTACFPNSGTFEGKRLPLLRWISAVLRSAQSRTMGAEASDDQAAIHHILLRNDEASREMLLPLTTIDVAGDRFLTLFPCLGADASTPKRFDGGKESCHDEGRRGHTPLEHVSFVGNVLSVHDRPLRDGQRDNSRGHGRKAGRHPFLVHANGYHFLLDTMLRRWHEDVRRPAFANGTQAGAARTVSPSLGERLWPPPPSLLDHPVLLLEARKSCSLSTLGAILPPAARAMSKVFLMQQRRQRRQAKPKPASGTSPPGTSPG
jgi:hypothetical protein